MDVASALSGDAAERTRPFRMPTQGNVIILIQSGRLTPDRQLVDALSERAAVLPFSGRTHPSATRTSWRAAAKAGGATHVVVCWGTIETAIVDRITKAVSWIPVAGWVVPDEDQRMRIAVQALVADLDSGQWRLFTAHSDESTASSSLVSRRSADLAAIQRLAPTAFRRLIAMLLATPPAPTTPGSP
jgi:hypothetical protein